MIAALNPTMENDFSEKYSVNRNFLPFHMPHSTGSLKRTASLDHRNAWTPFPLLVLNLNFRSCWIRLSLAISQLLFEVNARGKRPLKFPEKLPTPFNDRQSSDWRWYFQPKKNGEWRKLRGSLDLYLIYQCNCSRSRKKVRCFNSFVLWRIYGFSM